MAACQGSRHRSGSHGGKTANWKFQRDFVLGPQHRECARFGASATGRQHYQWKAECEQFLLRYRASILDTIVAEVRRYDRRVLAKACLDDYQGARVEQGRWRSTIKALRAISGEDANLAFDRQNEINAVQIFQGDL